MVRTKKNGECAQITKDWKAMYICRTKFVLDQGLLPNTYTFPCIYNAVLKKICRIRRSLIRGKEKEKKLSTELTIELLKLGTTIMQIWYS